MVEGNRGRDYEILQLCAPKQGCKYRWEESGGNRAKRTGCPNLGYLEQVGPTADHSIGKEKQYVDYSEFSCHFILGTMNSSNFTNIKSHTRIAQSLFKQLMGQFPITDKGQIVRLRKASDFAGKLNVHVNHLNRAVKLYVNKTTTQTINEHFVKESKRLLEETNWSITDIANVLGFKEGNHFSSFFKKHTGKSPSDFRENKNSSE